MAIKLIEWLVFEIDFLLRFSLSVFEKKKKKKKNDAFSNNLPDENNNNSRPLRFYFILKVFLKHTSCKHTVSMLPADERAVKLSFQANDQDSKGTANCQSVKVHTGEF